MGFGGAQLVGLICFLSDFFDVIPISFFHFVDVCAVFTFLALTQDIEFARYLTFPIPFSGNWLVSFFLAVRECA